MDVVVPPFNEKCLCSTSPYGYVKVQIIELVYSKDTTKIEDVLGHRERYWQSQLSQQHMGWTVSMIFTAKNVRVVESKSLFQLLSRY